MASIAICDVCGTKENVYKKSFYYDTITDAAGGSENIYESRDLCHKCELSILYSVFIRCNPINSQKVAKYLEKEVKGGLYK